MREHNVVELVRDLRATGTDLEKVVAIWRLLDEYNVAQRDRFLAARTGKGRRRTPQERQSHRGGDR